MLPAIAARSTRGSKPKVPLGTQSLCASRTGSRIMPSVRTPLARMLPRVMGVGFCIETGYRVGCLIGPYNNYFRSIDAVILLIESRRTTPRFRPHPSTPRLGLQCGWPYGQMVDADRQISEPLRVSQKSCSQYQAR